MSLRARLLAAYFLSGAAALIYEVLWARLLALFMGHTIAATSAVLAAFMGGLAAGAAIAARVLAHDAGRPWDATRLLRIYAALEIAIAAAGVMLPFALRA